VGYKVEAAGIAPASRDPSVSASTCVSARLIVGLESPVGRVPFGLSRHEFSPCLNRRFDTNDPALTSSGEASGRRPAAKPLGSAVRQPYGERVSSRHLSFGPLFTWPADQPRHATRHFGNPVDPGSPPSFQRALSVTTQRFQLSLSPTPGQGVLSATPSDRAVHVSFGVLFLQGVTLVVGLAASGDADLHLGHPVLEINLERHDRQASL